MQRIRSAYSVDMKCFSDDPSRVTRVQWYFVPDTNPWIGIEHSFGTSVWQQNWQENPPIGEQHGTETYSKGKPPFAVPSTGFCGTDSQWLNGSRSSDPLPPLQPGTLIPTCCGQLPPAEVGGLAIGGNATAAPVITSCPYLAPAPYQFQFTLSGITNGLCATCATSWNKTWVLTFGFHPNPACNWGMNPGTICGVPNSEIVLFYNDSPTQVLLTGPSQMGNYECLSFSAAGGVFTRTASAPDPRCAGWPATITVTPV